MEGFFSMIQKNPHRKECPTVFTKEKEEIRQVQPRETLWGGGIRGLTPARLTTAWLMAENPLMVVAGTSYKATEVRDQSFELQQEAVANLRGNRKLTKAKMQDALASLRPTADQTKVIAGILYSLKQIQTICFDEDKKTAWTMPEDLRAWSPSYRTLWVDSRCERMIDWTQTQEPRLGAWISAREDEGWTFDWPIADGSFDWMKQELASRGLSPAKPAEMGAKPKKEDYARALGRSQAIQKLMEN